MEATALVALTGMQALEVAVEWLRLVTKITKGTGKRYLTREEGNPRYREREREPEIDDLLELECCLTN